jgi:hypothetical protein
LLGSGRKANITLPLREVSITLIATVIRGQQSKQTSAPEQQNLTSS